MSYYVNNKSFNYLLTFTIYIALSCFVSNDINYTTVNSGQFLDKVFPGCWLLYSNNRNNDFEIARKLY